MYHRKSNARQLFANKLYQNINEGINKRPKDTEGCEYNPKKGIWIAKETNRNG
jgi:hypothetical protein